MLVSRGLALLHPQIGLTFAVFYDLDEGLSVRERDSKVRDEGLRAAMRYIPQGLTGIKKYLQGMQLGHAINCALC